MIRPALRARSRGAPLFLATALLAACSAPTPRHHGPAPVVRAERPAPAPEARTEGPAVSPEEAAPVAAPPLAERQEDARNASAQTGLASWYGGRFHGRRTASGERFDKRQLTAAHPQWPFNTRVRVQNLDNGRQLVVRINDRGPHVRGRIIDLSEGAARALGMGGLARVRIEAVEPLASAGDSLAR